MFTFTKNFNVFLAVDGIFDVKIMLTFLNESTLSYARLFGTSMADIMKICLVGRFPSIQT